MYISERFEQFDDDYIDFDGVQNKRSKRPDLHAFLLLDELFPGDTDLVSAAEHDEIYLDIDSDKLDDLTDEQIQELVRCGVRFSKEFDCLCMFV